jgi:hypothetical protein
METSPLVLLPEGSNDLQRIGKNTRVIVVDRENTATLKSGWRNPRSTVDDLNAKTGAALRNAQVHLANLIRGATL